MKKNKLITLVVALFVCSHSYAWNAVAHRVIANIAYANLTDNARAKVDSLVGRFHQEYPSISSFDEMAPWPDELHGQKIESFSHWHYFDLPLSGDGTPVKNLADTDNAVWAINMIKPVLKNTHANDYERARFLAFLIHIEGDLHQPLHTVSRISAEHLDGDQGGNLFSIIDPVSKSKITLHKYWDGGLGVFDQNTNNKSLSNETIASLSTDIMAHYPSDYFGAAVADLSPDHWASDGFGMASEFVYSTPERQVPNATYIDSGKKMAEQRVALAGYRLANLLNSLLS